MGERYLLCQSCSAAIDLSAAVNGETISCVSCAKVYDIHLDVDFAEYSTASTDYFKWSADGTHIVKYYFHNMTLENLEGIAEKIKSLNRHERRPSSLLPIFKAMHDCLKKRLQEYLVYDRIPNLSPEKKAQIETDLPLPGFNVIKLTDLLAEAYPQHRNQIVALRDNDLLKILLWIRNKEEHLALAMWPTKSYVHAEKAKTPNDQTGHLAELSIPLAVETLTYCIDFLRSIYDIDPGVISQWQYDQLEQFRIHCTQ